MKPNYEAFFFFNLNCSKMSYMFNPKGLFKAQHGFFFLYNQFLILQLRQKGEKASNSSGKIPLVAGGATIFHWLLREAKVSPYGLHRSFPTVQSGKSFFWCVHASLSQPVLSLLGPFSNVSLPNSPPSHQVRCFVAWVKFESTCRHSSIACSQQ